MPSAKLTKTIKCNTRMGKATRKKFMPKFKTRVVLAALSEQSTLAELSKKYEVSSAMVSH